MQPDDSLANMTPQIMILPAAEYDWLVKWLDEPDKLDDYPKLKEFFEKPRVFSKDCQ